MSRYHSAAAIILVAIAAGCVHVPQAAIDVNKQVSIGITSISENGQEMINAWEETGYMVLDDRWSQVYRRAEVEYRKKKNLADSAVLNSQQQEDVAGLATLIRDDVRKKIHNEANKMRQIISANTKTTLEANNSITNLLISASSMISSQQTALKEVTKLIPIPPEIVKFVSNAISM